MQTSFCIPADGEYTAMLGRAVYNFSYYEGAIIWTIEKMNPGYPQRYIEKGLTSGIVSRDFHKSIHLVAWIR
jgi:hypothetical protein